MKIEKCAQEIYDWNFKNCAQFSSINPLRARIFDAGGMGLKRGGCDAERLGHAVHLLRKSRRHAEEGTRLNNTADRHPGCHRYHRRPSRDRVYAPLCTRSGAEEYLSLSLAEVEKRPSRCGDTRFSRSPDNGPFVRHCVRGTLIVSLRPDDLRGYDSRPPPPFRPLLAPLPRRFFFTRVVSFLLARFPAFLDALSRT